MHRRPFCLIDSRLSMRLMFFLVLLCGTGSISVAQTERTEGWPMRNFDQRRTGQSIYAGPRQGASVWRYVAEDGMAINMEPCAIADGVFFGTWGLVRKTGTFPAQWDKCDGKFYGLSLAAGTPLWAPVHPGRTPYRHEDAKALPGNANSRGKRSIWQSRRPAQSDGRINYYNGTVEGTPAYDPQTGTLYWGRGDGKLYAQDAATGKVLWSFETSDPARSGEPETGGEVVGGPLIGRNGNIYFATFAAPERQGFFHFETNAIYAINKKGQLLWRYPQRGSIANPFVAPLAFSPDGNRIYAVTALIKDVTRGDVFCLDPQTGTAHWTMSMKDLGGQDLAVGADGRIYIAGMMHYGFRTVPQVMALQDQKTKGMKLWGPNPVDGLRSGTRFAGGLALREVDGKVQSLVVSTTTLRNMNGNEGSLHVMDPDTGRILRSWHPREAQPAAKGGLTDVTIDRDGLIYVGARGRHQAFRSPAEKGRMYALKPADHGFEILWSHQVNDQLDWASPAIGPDGGLYFGSSSPLPPLSFIMPHNPKANIANADPVFYGIHDSH